MVFRMRFNVARIECIIIFLILFLISIVGGAKFTDWTASLAVLLGFIYAQRSFDAVDILQNGDSQSIPPSKDELQKIFVMKECVWMVTFYTIGSYPLLCGALVFAVYPAVRKSIRVRTR